MERSARKRVRDLLHTGTDAVSAAPRVAELRESEAGSRRPLGELKNREDIKREVYALSTLALEYAYPYAAAITEAHPDGVPVFSSNKEPVFKARAELDPLEEHDSHFFFVVLGESFGALMAMGLRQWSTEMSMARMAPTRQSDPAVRVYRRLRNLLYSGRYKSPEDPGQFLVRGANTAAVTSRDILLAIALRFRDAKGRAPSPEEFSELAKSGKRLALDLASMHLSSLAELVDYGKNQLPPPEQGTIQEDHFPVQFPPELFRVTEPEKGAFVLEFDESFIADWRAHQDEVNSNDSPRRKRFGCSAIAAQVLDDTGHRTSLVNEAYDYTERLAQEFLVPHLEAFIESVDAGSPAD